MTFDDTTPVRLASERKRRVVMLSRVLWENKQLRRERDMAREMEKRLRNVLTVAMNTLDECYDIVAHNKFIPKADHEGIIRDCNNKISKILRGGQ